MPNCACCIEIGLFDKSGCVASRIFFSELKKVPDACLKWLVYWIDATHISR